MSLGVVIEEQQDVGIGLGGHSISSRRCPWASVDHHPGQPLTMLWNRGLSPRLVRIVERRDLVYNPFPFSHHAFAQIDVCRSSVKD